MTGPHGTTDSLDAIAAEVVACRACPRLVDWRERVAAEKRAAFHDDEYWGKAVPGFGDPNAHLAIVGLAPAAHGANRTGRMFTGDRSGDFLVAALFRAGYANQPESTGRDDGLELRGAWITAPVRCAPPGNRPTADELQRCRPFLERELDQLANVSVILALGGVGFSTVCRHVGLRPVPRFAHGAEIDLGDGRSLLASYHVSQLNTFTGRLTAEMFDAILARARHLGVRTPG